MNKFKVGDTLVIKADCKITGLGLTGTGVPMYNTNLGLTIPEHILEQIAETRPAPEPVKLYCIKDICRAFEATKGKVYELSSDATMLFDNGMSRSDSHMNTWDEWKRGNPDYAANLVPLVKRPAKVGEWVYIAEGMANGVIGEVLKINEHGYPTVRHPDVWGLFSDEYGMERTLFSKSAYLVLDGYKPEPEHYNGKIFCAAVPSNVRNYTEGRIYEVRDGIVVDDKGKKRPIEQDDILLPSRTQTDPFKTFAEIAAGKCKWYEVKEGA